ncbi:MAG: autotransporter-associated beta strand repeat-containing protein [Verrucomicrobia bacterium]|nr:autotransporter-associated beta strand repeat-containing protein [Verrucomicrobiota bacterium]
MVVGLAVLAPSARSQTTVYWDLNGTTAGAGTTPTGAWNTAGAAFWNTNSTGGAGTFASWTQGNHAVFSAGTDATGTYTVTLGTGITVANLTFQEGAATITGNTLTIANAGSTIDVASGLTARIDSLLAGSGAITKTGTGTLVLGSNTFNTHSGNINVNAGVLESAKQGAVGAIDNAAAVSILAGATLRFNGNSTYNIETIGSLSGAGTLEHLGAAAPFTLKINGGASTTFSGTITDGANDLAIEKNTGTGTLTLSGANSYTGTTTVNAGVINIQNATALGTTAGGTVVASGAALQIQGGIAVGAEALTISGTGVGTTGALRNISGNNSFAGTITVAANSEIQSDAGTLTLSGTINGDAASRTLRFDGAGNTTVTNVIGSNISTLTKNSAGTLTLSGANTYTGATAVTAGVLNVQNSAALGSTGAGTTVSSGAALELQNNLFVGAEALSLSGTGVSSNGALRNISGANSYAGVVTLAAATEIQSDAGTLTVSGAVNSTNLGLTVDGSGNTTLSGVVGLGTAGVTKNGTGTLTLSGTSANTFTGALTVNDGTVQLAKTGAVNAVGGNTLTIGNGVGAASSANLVLQAYQQIPDTATVTVNSDGRFALNNFSEKIDRIAGTGLIDLSTSGFLTVGTNNGSSTFGGTVAGTGTLIKEGSGSLTFNSAINFAGELTLSGGTLALNATTLTVGTLHITGNSILDFGSSTASILNATTFIVDAGVTLTIANWVNGVDYFFATSWTGASPDVRGTTPMNQVTFTGFSNSTTAWLGYDKQITPVPEPATYGALFVAAASALAFWRRRAAPA